MLSQVQVNYGGGYLSLSPTVCWHTGDLLTTWSKDFESHQFVYNTLASVNSTKQITFKPLKYLYNALCSPSTEALSVCTMGCIRGGPWGQGYG